MQPKNVLIFNISLNLLCLLASQEARAQSIDTEVGVFADKTDQGSAFSFSPLFGLEIPAGKDWAVNARLGFVYTDWSPDSGNGMDVVSGDSTFRVGNPFVGARYSLMDESIKLSIGGGVGIPLASYSLGDTAESTAYTHTVAIRGMYDLWLWRNRTLSFIFPLKLELDELPLVNIRGEAAAGALIAVSGEEKSGLLLQLSGEAGLDLGLLEPGVRLQFVWVPLDKGDNAQTAIEPYLRLGLSPVYARLGLLINLDKPLGFAFDSDGYWGVRLSFGFEF